MLIQCPFYPVNQPPAYSQYELNSPHLPRKKLAPCVSGFLLEEFPPALSLRDGDNVCHDLLSAGREEIRHWSGSSRLLKIDLLLPYDTAGFGK